MNGFSTVDGFVVITECLGEMIKYVANEPSIGLFYVQQHTQNAVPNVIALNHNIVDKSRETMLHTEDMEDSIAAMKSMKDCGFSMVDEMVTDIRDSLTRISTTKPRRGLVHNSASTSQMGSAPSWGPTSWGRSSSYGNNRSSYFSSVFKSARQKANILKWPEQRPMESQKLAPHPAPPQLSESPSTSASGTDELPLSGEVVDESHEGGEKEKAGDDAMLVPHHTLSVSQDFDDFKADKEARLELWLEGAKGDAENSEGAATETKALA